MATMPMPPSDFIHMDQALQQQFEMMQLPPLIITAALVLWSAWKTRSPLPIYLFLSAGIAFMAEPLSQLAGLGIYPPEGMHTVWSAFNRPVPLFGFLAYLWFLGGLSCIVYSRLRKGMTMRGIFILYGILVVVEAALEIPGLNTNTFLYYGPQPFVLMKFPLWWAFVNAGAAMLAACLVFKMKDYVKPVFYPVFLWAVPLANSGIMGGAAMPTQIALNRNESLLVTHIAALWTVALCFFVIWMIALLCATDSRARAGASQN